MTISNPRYTRAYVWIWLPGKVEPVIAGVLTSEGNDTVFTYGRSYLDNDAAISIHEDELPLRPGEQPLISELHIPNCIRDAAPDAWGRRVIMNKLLGTSDTSLDTTELDNLTYLLESGSDRIGALDFQHSSTEYTPRLLANATMDELLRAADKVEQGIPLSLELDQALLHGSSIGGARPKALVEEHDKKYIAKFSSSTDLYSVVKAEYIAMKLARLVGLNVAPVQLTRCLNKDVLLIERFDRVASASGWLRRHMLSALTLFGLDTMRGRYASYEDLAEIIRHRFRDPKATLREMYSRLVFNVLCGNTDDHAKNHAVFWEGDLFELTPAYDICPQPRSGNEVSQAMLITGQKKLSQIATCLQAAPAFHLDEVEARRIALDQVQTITNHWDTVCNEAALSIVDRRAFWNRQFLNPFSMVGLE